MKKIIKLVISIAMIAACFAAAVFAIEVKTSKYSEIDFDNYVNVKEYGAKGDGTQDDTKAIQDAADVVAKKRSVLYFPAGTYNISDTIVNLKYAYGMNIDILGESRESVHIVASESLNGNIITSLMRSGFSVSNISFEHKGKGSIIDAFSLNVMNCSFSSVSGNDKELVIFYGSNCKVAKSSFKGENPDAFMLKYTKKHDTITKETGDAFIAINSYITGNSFEGSGKGVIITSEVDNERLEGVKVCENTFTNTGAEQITVTTVLSADVSNNKMSGSSKAGVMIRPTGLLVHGLFVCGNEISAAYACVMTDEGANHSTVISVCDNKLIGGEYGYKSASSIGSLIIDNNTIEGQSNTGIEAFGIGAPQIITDNLVNVAGGAKAISILGNGKGTIVADNAVNAKVTVTDDCKINKNNYSIKGDR